MKKEYEERVAKAVDYFMQGYGCCQSVVCAFSDLYGLDLTMSKRTQQVLVAVLAECA